jgi:uncharacterized membrane protein
MKTSRLYWLVGLSCVAVVATFLFYRHTFPAGLVYCRGDWGTFGDYFGGVLNPILGLVNIVLLAYISKKVADLDAGRHTEALTIEEKRYQNTLKIDAERHDASMRFQKEIARYELKHSALAGAVQILSTIDVEASKPLPLIYELTDLRDKLTSFLLVHEYLFPHFEPARDEFFNVNQDIIGTVLNANNNKTFGGDRAAEIADELSKHLKKLQDLKEKLVKDAKDALQN